jgi:hypothetical protein
MWTTNFDQLIERAFALEPIAERIEGGLTSCDLTCPQKAEDSFHDERWPVLVKLHGDFQYRRLKNTTEELASQDASLRKVFVTQCRQRGLAVVGYSGRDTSIMKSLHEALNEQTAFPHGLFWFIRHGAEPPNPAVELLEAARSKGIQAGCIEIGGFDELMADLFLPYHDDMPAIRDIIRRQRDRRQPAPLTYNSSRSWPVLRTNALEVFDFPATCTVFQASIGGSEEVRAATRGHEAKLCVARRKIGLVAFQFHWRIARLSNHQWRNNLGQHQRQRWRRSA